MGYAKAIIAFATKPWAIQPFLNSHIERIHEAIERKEKKGGHSLPSPPFSTLPATVLTSTSSGQNEVRLINGRAADTHKADGVRSDPDHRVRPVCRYGQAGSERRAGDPHRPEIEQVLSCGRIGSEVQDRIVAETRGTKHERIVAGHATTHHVVTPSADDEVVTCTTHDRVGQPVASAHKVATAAEKQILDVGIQGCLLYTSDAADE